MAARTSTEPALPPRSWPRRIAGLCGVVSPPLILGLILTAVTISPWFSWQDNALSDMGTSPAAWIFNTALIVGGLLNVGLALGMWQWAGPGWLPRLGSGGLFVAAVLLSLIGVFTEDHEAVHVAVAAGYFVLTPVGYLLLGTAWLRRGVRVPGILTIAAGIAALLLIALTPHHDTHGIAVPEILAALVISCWSFSMGVILLAASSGESQ
ncbi:MAG: DUF998 domain-containing protein [Chloroflexi bacterium]|nr:DUF998 domain-containing protein [Chloroflexota bacterium]MBU1751800.1 DUF998 domain-containing protein [Chloroflexota bacterium]